VGGIEKDADGVMILDTSVSLKQTWRNMEALVDAGKAKSIGVRSAHSMPCIPVCPCRPSLMLMEFVKGMDFGVY
jgi:hypothetical protein